ncbi:sigma-54 dependent transcriptional regulator [Desulfovulcanus sp.]
MMTQFRVLFIDDEESLRFSYKSHLKTAGYKVEVAADYGASLLLIHSFNPDLIIADIILGGHTGIDLLREVKKLGLDCPVIMITGQPNVETAMEAVRLGAFDYLAKPVRKEILLKIANHALTQKKMAAEKKLYHQNVGAVFQSLKDGIISMGHNLEILQANDAFFKICSFSLRRLSGRNFETIGTRCSKACLKIVKQTISLKKSISEREVMCQCNDRPDQVVMVTTSVLKSETDKFNGVVMIIRDMTRLTDLERELSERQKFHKIIGKSSQMQKVYKLLKLLADTDTTVLIRGESGTGKELVATALHQLGKRADNKMVTIDCSALTENILESELFGHVKGSFTGAIRDKIGHFQLADRGTIFLDEIGHISIGIQRKLLRFLQEKEFVRVGGTSPVKVDVRIITATNVDLEDKVRQGEFREDIFYRLKVMEIFLPPLRERTVDIPLLVDHFIHTFNKKMNRRIKGISKDVLDLFMIYHWPGNIRELEHTLEHAFILCQNGIITLTELPLDIRESQRLIRKKSSYASDEKNQLIQVLKETDWNKAKAARKLGIDRRTIYRKIEKYKITGPSE